MRDELDGKIIKVFVALRPIMYNCIIYGGCVSKKAKFTEKCVIETGIKFEDYKPF